MDFLYKHGWSLFLLIAGIAVLIATFFNSISDANQKDKIEKLTTNIDSLTQSNKKITEENLEISQQSNQLILQIKDLSSRIDELVKSVDKRTAYAAEESLQSGEIQINFESEFKDKISVKFGREGLMVTNNRENIKKGAKFFVFGGVDPVTFNLDKDKLTISLQVVDIEGNVIAEIQDNFWRPYKNFTGLMNYDERGFEVLDQKGNVAVSIDVIESNNIIIQGIFPIKSTETILIAGKSFVSIPLNHQRREILFSSRGTSLEKIIEETDIQRIFVYTGNDWLHKRRVKN